MRCVLRLLFRYGALFRPFPRSYLQVRSCRPEASAPCEIWSAGCPSPAEALRAKGDPPRLIRVPDAFLASRRDCRWDAPAILRPLCSTRPWIEKGEDVGGISKSLGGVSQHVASGCCEECPDNTGAFVLRRWAAMCKVRRIGSPGHLGYAHSPCCNYLIGLYLSFAMSIPCFWCTNTMYAQSNAKAASQ